MSDFNEKFDKELKTNCKVSRKVFDKFIEAYEYDAASTINWLISKLKILIEELESGRTIYIKYPENKLINSFSELIEWLSSHFDEFLLEILRDEAIYEATQFNRLFDERIIKTRIITHEDLLRFDEAYNNDSASSISWLLSKLRLLNKMIKQGDYVYIYEVPRIEIYTKEGFIKWVKERYSFLSEEIETKNSSN